MRRGLILAAAMMPGLALAQDDQPGLLTRFLQDNLSGAGRTVTVSGFQGALSSRATIAEMTIADATGVWLTLRGVTLDWNRAAVLRGRFSVNELSATEVIMLRPPEPEPGLPAPEATGFALPELPISVEIGRVLASRVDLGPDVLGQAVEASLEASVQLADGEGQATLSLIRMDEGPAGRVALDASYSNTSRLLVLNLDAHEGAGGIAATKLGLPGTPATEFQVQGQGIIDDFGADIRLATDGTDRLAGRVTLAVTDDAHSFTAVLAGDPAPLFVPEHAAFFGNDVRLDVAGTQDASGALELSKLSVATKALHLDGNLRTGPNGVPNRFALTGRIAAEDGSPVLLPTGGAQTWIDRADVLLSYDAAQDDGWTGQASLSGLTREDLALGQVLLTGSGRIRAGVGDALVGATLRVVAAGVQPNDPALAEALGPAVTGLVKLVWQEGKPLAISDLTLAGADYTVQTRGRVTGLSGGIGLEGSVTAELAELARFSGLAGRPLGGAVRLAAKGKGSVLGGDLDLTGAMQGERLTLGQAQADALLAAPSRIAFSIARGAEGTEIRQLDLSATSLEASVGGWVRSSGSDLKATLRFDDLAVLGGAYEGALSGTAEISGTPETGRLSLDARANGLAIGQPEADRLLRGQSTVSLAIRRDADMTHIDRISLDNPQVTLLATGQGTEGRREVAVNGRLADLGLLLPDFPGPLTLAGSIIDEAAGYLVDLRATGPGQIDARATGRVAATGGQADLSVTGTAQAALANPFIDPRTISGLLRFDMRLNGPLGLNALSGTVGLSGGRVAAPLLGLSLERLDAEARLAGGRATITADAAAVAGGNVGVRGTVDLAPPFQGDLVVSPRGMVLRDPELFETRIDGEVRIAGPLTGGALISGALTLPETEIRVPSTDLGASGAIPDLAHRNEPADVRATRARAGILRDEEKARNGGSRPFALDLVINAPSRMFLRGRGLDAELGGTLRIAGTTASVTPSGGIDLIRGRLDILGRRLDLTEAQVRLEGSLDPKLRVVAANSSDGITSQVVIEGRISQPEISFSSTPELPEEEVLAHLLFGRNLNSLSPFQAVQLANAVATLAGRGGDGLIGKLRRSFGLDDLDFATDAAGGTSVRAGRYIAKNLYTDVTLGDQGTTELNLNLDVGRGVTVRGSADSQGNTGIGAVIERDY